MDACPHASAASCKYLGRLRAAVPTFVTSSNFLAGGIRSLRKRSDPLGRWRPHRRHRRYYQAVRGRLSVDLAGASSLRPCVAMRRQSRRRMKGFEQARALVRRPCWRKFATSVCSDATPVASTYEGFRTDGSACPSTLLAQVRYVVADVAIESFLDMESDGLKAELQQCPMDPQGGGGTPSSASLPVFGTSSDFRADGIICGSIVGIAGYAPIEAG
jgi:hypothetical protein